MRQLKRNYWLIWQIGKCGSAQNVINICEHYGIKQLLIKVLDGTLPFNRLGRNDDKALKAWLTAIRTAKGKDGKPLNITVDGWPFVYGLVSPGAQADAIMERREKLDLEIILANIEDRRFENLTITERKRFMRIYWERQHEGTQYSLCSHRYPLWHPYIPYNTILKQERCDVNTPMVYWEGLHDPARQLRRSKEEYDSIRAGVPFLPIGSAYARGGWSPTTDDFEEYVTTCDSEGWIWGMYSLDYVIRFSKWDWLEAITGIAPPGQWEPPGPIQVISGRGANVRRTPVIDPTNRNKIGAVPYGYELYAEEETQDGDWFKVSAYIHKSTVRPK